MIFHNFNGRVGFELTGKFLHILEDFANSSIIKTTNMSEPKNDINKSIPEEPKKAAPGEGIRSMRATYAFRAINFELYAKPSE